MLTLFALAHAYVYWTPPDVLASFFPGATVESVVFAPTNAESAGITGQVGPILPQYAIQVARNDGEVVGYAILDAERGQHEPIDFAVSFSPTGQVQRVEILTYREAYGDGVRADSFRAQFTGRGPSSGFRAGKDIQIVSGATISSRSISVGVKRATVVLNTWLAP